MYFETASYNFYLFLQLTRAINIIAKSLLHIDFNVIHNNVIIDSTINVENST